MPRELNASTQRASTPVQVRLAPSAGAGHPSPCCRSRRTESPKLIGEDVLAELPRRRRDGGDYKHARWLTAAVRAPSGALRAVAVLTSRDESIHVGRSSGAVPPY